MPPDPSVERPESLKHKAIAVILNLLSVEVETPFEVIPGHILRQATIHEIENIRNLLKQFDVHGHNHIRLLESKDIRPTIGSPPYIMNESFVGTTNPNEWRYWVVEVTYTNPGSQYHHIDFLEIQSRLLDTLLRFGLRFLLNEDGTVRNASSGLRSSIGADAFQCFHAPWRTQRIDENYIKQLRELHRLYFAPSRGRENIVNAIQKYHHLAAIGREHPLFGLGIFAVIESILTHDSKGVYDSLGRQIRTKMELLNHRFDSPLDMSLFQKMTFDKLWKELYSYRSCLAHGKHPNFDCEFKSLRSEANTIDFLENAAKRLLIQALKEPDLITDLQEC